MVLNLSNVFGLTRRLRFLRGNVLSRFVFEVFLNLVITIV